MEDLVHVQVIEGPWQASCKVEPEAAQGGNISCGNNLEIVAVKF